MIDTIAIVFLFVVAIGGIVSIHRERRAADRALHDARARFYKGGLL